MTSLGKATAHPAPPFVAVLGGANVSEKLPLLTHLLDKASGLLLGGGMASTLLPAQGDAVGNSLVEPQCIALARDVCTRAVTQGRQFVLPSDHVIAQARDAQSPTHLVAAEGIPDGWMGLDIGPCTMQQFQEVLAHARTMVWNGPMGVCELSPFREGTCALAHAVAACKGTTIVGGRDTIAALTLAGCTEAITHVSTGGRASLVCLEGKVLPGIACLNAR
jgi:phosphoglycerate kinase